MSKVSEETTKGLVAKKLMSFSDYPSNQNTQLNNITWFKEDSYKQTAYDWLSAVFSTASKKQTNKSKGTPDFIVVKEKSNAIIIIECKGDINHHSTYQDLSDYIHYGFGTPAETEAYAINGALWYASFLCDRYDVIAVGVSGQNEIESKVTSFIWPKGGEISDIRLYEDGTLNTALVSITTYQKDVDIILDRFADTEANLSSMQKRWFARLSVYGRLYQIFTF